MDRRSPTFARPRCVVPGRWPAVALLPPLAFAAALLVLPGLLTAADVPTRAAPGAAADPAVAALVARVDLDRALDEARRLSGELPLCLAEDCATLGNRVTGSADLERAVDWLAEHAAVPGFAVTVGPWARAGKTGRNVFARRAGVLTPTEEIWYVAHVDGVASCPEGRCPAADDNASGTLAGLELLRALEGRPTARTVVVMFSTGEEQDSLGVRAWLDAAPPAELARIRALVNADMLAWDGDGDRVMELYHGDEAASIRLAEAMSATLAVYAPNLRPRINPGCG
ncbi:MAG: M28 family peptidase [Caldilineae bacterium]|nr:M28 family peptidase [Chloroflexota bacterium]MCB9176052.1 M28 family peptidase [Caldilineae bacterium]